MIDWIANQVDMRAFADDCVRLFVAARLGGLLGLEHEIHGRWAGLRTHLMVALGAAILTMADSQWWQLLSPRTTRTKSLA